ncbi:ABC transporter ATP-binding protein [Macrococcus sp. DPC7161]|nr:ABC transporter ATP-binding protein [Macrococcus sp. DPC7161]
MSVFLFNKGKEGIEMIKVNQLNLYIGKHHILKNINLNIEQGDAIALVGPNGAGKSTLIDCLLGNKSIASGHIDGQSLILNHHKTSVLYQHTYFTPNMKVIQIIRLFQSLYNNPLSLDEIKQITHFDETNLSTEANRLSGGQKRILDVSLTLMGRPEVIILDEPTVGMDTSTRKRFYELVQNLKNEGKTILFTSHYIEEVESLADRIVLLHKGEIVRDSTPRRIRSESHQKQIVLPRKYEIAIKGIAPDMTIKDDSILFVSRDVQPIITQMLAQGVNFNDVEITNESLLDRIFKVVEEDHNETV